MKVNLHIQRLVIDGPTGMPEEEISAAVTAALSAQLTEGSLPGLMSRGGARAEIIVPDINTAEQNPADIGQQIGGAIWKGLDR